MLTYPQSEFMSYAEVAAEFNIRIGSLYALVCTKKIPHIRLGNRFVRFSRKELRQWLDLHRVACQGECGQQYESTARELSSNKGSE